MIYAQAIIDGIRVRMATRLAMLCVTGGLVLAGTFPAQAETLEERVDALERETASHDNRLVKWHLSGYMSAGFQVSETDNDPEGSTNTFTPVRFAPIFHFLYDNVVLFQAEPELTITDEGETEIELEYATAALLLHDRASVVIGKFLSPIGQFQERLHPAWVNKLPTAPAGYGHGGAAPLTDLGLQVRGGVPFGNAVFGYTVYVSNGPQVALHHGRVEIEGEATTASRDEKTFGGRFSIIPIPHLEFGVSAILANKLTGEAASLQTRPDYRLIGADGAFTMGPWDVRFEYIDTELDAFVDAEGDAAPATKPSLWYAQAAYQIGGRWEPVIRYGELDYEAWDTVANTLVKRKTKRTSVGINYLFTPSLIAKLAYETDDLDFAADQDRYIVQIAYGF